MRRSSPKVDIGPWPGTNCDVVAERPQLLRDRADQRVVGRRAGNRCGRSSPGTARRRRTRCRARALAKTTWPGVWPGQCSTSSAISPTVATSPSSEPAVGRERPRAGNAEARALPVEAVDPECVVAVRALDRHAGAFGDFGDAAAVVDVAVRDQHLLQRRAGRRDAPRAGGRPRRRDRRARRGWWRADDQRAVLLEGRDGDDRELHAPNLSEMRRPLRTCRTCCTPRPGPCRRPARGACRSRSRRLPRSARRPPRRSRAG